MNSILFLVHRLPYPPNKGDKITSFNLLKYLSKRYPIYLACFVDDKADWQHVGYVKSFCKESCILGLNSKAAKIFSVRGLLTGEPLSLPYYRSQKMQTWVDDVLKLESIDSVLIFSGVMAQYVTGKIAPEIRTVLDLEDVDSDKWRSYAKGHRWPMSWIYRREAERLLAFESAMAEEFDATVFVSKDEAEFFKSLVPSVADKVVHRVQGVDSAFFDPALDYENPYRVSDRVLVFTGAMDYWPNINAAVWFAKKIFPKVRAQVNNACFYIVGMNPSDEVKTLENISGVFVTGGVPDMRPYIAHAEFSVVPLRLARGIQNKVLEAMAMEKPILATSNALLGIHNYPGFLPLTADDEKQLIEGALALLAGTIGQNVQSGRACVLEHYNWDTNLRKIELLLQDGLEVNS
ncbi:MAG: TIGR03087 family PEP-CTERM/XrtA system glycosyltransferase [Methylovulum sp.]|nr:TIGR03087 family PEP-CTERM/XrtA system glycosyltransferase [Methylovulum sp.]